jgi:hypothetical protein
MNPYRSAQWKINHEGFCERKDVHPPHEWMGLYQWWCPGTPGVSGAIRPVVD